MTTIVALGGNALVREGERGSAAEQRARLRETCAALAPLLADSKPSNRRGEGSALPAPIVVTHGNGPQVGNELLRQERAADEVPPLPLYLAVAQTQAEIGALIETELAPVAGRAVACLLTHVRVDRADPAFAAPTKPVGPHYDERRARGLERERGWALARAGGQGWRRVVPSPEPLEVIELRAIRALLAAGTIVVACGGGGIPVEPREGRLLGVDAVIDKDRASALLAGQLEARRLVILTDVPAVYRRFGTPGQEELRELSPAAAEALLPELDEGSMRPKVQAALSLARAGGEALIASADTLAAALAGRAGTRIRG